MTMENVYRENLAPVSIIPDMQICPKCKRQYAVTLIEKGTIKSVRTRRRSFDAICFFTAKIDAILCLSECGYYESFLPNDIILKIEHMSDGNLKYLHEKCINTDIRIAAGRQIEKRKTVGRK